MTASVGLCSAQSDAIYQGPSGNHHGHRAGHGDQYLKGLAKILKAPSGEKKEGLIVSYKVLMGQAATPGDFDIMNGGIQEHGRAFMVCGPDDQLCRKLSAAKTNSVSWPCSELREIMGTNDAQQGNSFALTRRAGIQLPARLSSDFAGASYTMQELLLALELPIRRQNDKAHWLPWQLVGCRPHIYDQGQYPGRAELLHAYRMDIKRRKWRAPAGCPGRLQWRNKSNRNDWPAREMSGPIGRINFSKHKAPSPDVSP
jgi:hypothetical protein